MKTETVVKTSVTKITLSDTFSSQKEMSYKIQKTCDEVKTEEMEFETKIEIKSEEKWN